jgi:hypothetical protein
MKAETKERQAQAGPASGKGKKRSGGAKTAQPVKGKSRDVVAAATGKSATIPPDRHKLARGGHQATIYLLDGPE